MLHGYENNVTHYDGYERQPRFSAYVGGRMAATPWHAIRETFRFFLQRLCESMGSVNDK